MQWSRKVFQVSRQTCRWSWCASPLRWVKIRSGSTRSLSAVNHDLIASPCSGKKLSLNAIISITVLSAADKKSDAEALASNSRSPPPLNTHQCTSRRTPRSCMLRSVAPAPISMSSECAPRQRTDNRSPGPTELQGFHGATLTTDTRSRAPRRLAPFDHLLEHLSIPQRIHGPPEALVFVRHQFSGFDQTIERLEHQLFTVLDIIKNLFAKDKIAGVDPNIRLLTRTYAMYSSPVHRIQSSEN